MGKPIDELSHKSIEELAADASTKLSEVSTGILYKAETVANQCGKSASNYQICHDYLTVNIHPENRLQLSRF